MEALLIGLATAFNFLILKTKIEKSRYQDAIFDAIVLLLLSIMFGGTLGGMVIATIGSAIVSLSLLISPPKFLSNIETTSFVAEFKSKLPPKK
jgi:hypothetical protein